jgi:serine/threonine protein kinase
VHSPVPFGNYLLLERINVGGMAEVFKAKAFGVEGFERLVAVKRILPTIAEDTEFITMFVDEAKIAVQLTHANIVQVFDLGKVGDSYFIAMEYVPGKDLRAMYERARKQGERLPIGLITYVVMKICEGLDYAHNKRDPSGHQLNLVHRDVSPQNMLISYDGDVKIADFGVAKARGKTGQTQAGILKGKFGYMSPEQVRGLPIDRRSDIFALGIILYELVTGQRLFFGESDFSTLEKVRNVDVAPPSTYNPSVPPELERIILKALAKQPEERYASALDLHDDLQSFMYTHGSSFGRKELAAYMRSSFAQEIMKESEREEYYRSLESSGNEGGSDAPARDAFPRGLETRPVSVGRAVPAAQSAGKAAGRSSLFGGASAPAAPSVYGARTTAAPDATQLQVDPPTIMSEDSTSFALPVNWDEEELSTQLYQKDESSAEGQPGQSYPAQQRHVANDPGEPTVDLHSPVVKKLPSLSDLPAIAGASAPYPSGAGPAVRAAGTGLPTPPAGIPSLSSMIPPPADSPVHAGLAGNEPAMGAGGVPIHRPSAPYPQGSAGPIHSARSPGGFGVPGRAAEPSVPFRLHSLGTSSSDRPSRIGTGVAGGTVRVRNTFRNTWRPWSPNVPKWAVSSGMAVVGLVLLAGLVMLYFRRSGSIQFVTEPADAMVLFNRQPLPATSSPFLIEDVEPSQRHLLTVSKPGFRTYETYVSVQPGEPLILPKIDLQPESQASATSSPGVAGVSVRSEPAGARIFVDGVERPERTPATLTAIAPGAHTLRLDHGASFEPWETQIQVSPDRMLDLPSVRLAPRGNAVRFDSNPPGANVVLVRGSERRSIGQTPLTYTFEGGGAWVVEVSKEGYQPYVQPLNVDPASPSPGLVANLVASSAPSTQEPRIATGSARSARSTRARPSRGRDSDEGSSLLSQTTDDAADTTVVSSSAGGGALAPSGGFGTLRINTQPWSQVFVDGRLIGNTPQMAISLPAGTHKVTLINGEYNIRKTLVVTIVNGRTETKIINLLQ